MAEESKPISTGGRPSWMNVPEYHDEICAQVLQLGAQGLSEAEISAEIGVPRTTMRRWAYDRESFASALTRAKELEMAWWEKQARTNLTTTQFNANLWNKSMSARFRSEYGEKLDMAVAGEVRHDVEFHIVDPANKG